MELVPEANCTQLPTAPVPGTLAVGLMRFALAPIECLVSGSTSMSFSMGRFVHSALVSEQIQEKARIVLSWGRVSAYRWCRCCRMAGSGSWAGPGR